ncbi:DUF1648 domain-containing protein [Methermicoccus shengliensis]|uniref:DUF1648 domain-containing protein n=1 Tax=Methermicoccus shengliensis TaxID=660064 RepID=UPI0005B2BC00|nr:DUF1648 domain-containing protein [Methermicoccus shengliensis]
MEQIKPKPLPKRGKLMLWLIMLSLAAIWTLAIHVYLTLPSQVSVHFGFSGEPTRYGEKSAFLIIPITFSIAPIIILLVTKYRFTLINKHPYLMNLPAFFTYITKIPKDRRSLWVNRYFEAVLTLGVFLTFSLLIIEYGIYLGEVSGKLPLWFMPLTLSMPLWLIIPFLIYLRKLSQEIEIEVEN